MGTPRSVRIPGSSARFHYLDNRLILADADTAGLGDGHIGEPARGGLFGKCLKHHGDASFCADTREFRAVLEGIPLSTPEVVAYIGARPRTLR